MIMIDKSNNSKCNKPCPCKCDKSCYNNKNCCYLQPKDMSIVQANDPTLYQVITDLDNLYLTAIPLEINTAGFTIESSDSEKINDILFLNESGVYSIYLSLKYSFKFNDSAKQGEIFKVNIAVYGNGKEIFSVQNTITTPKIVGNQSEEIINTIQRSRLQVVDENLPYKINIFLKEFDFDLVLLNQVIISDLTLIVEKII